MSNVDLARWQFAFTTVNHFLFVPITIGLAFLTALLQTAWYRSKREEYLRLTRFFGTLLVINGTRHLTLCRRLRRPTGPG
jgi:cytochrome d ubiquinol oxidase subunit I